MKSLSESENYYKWVGTLTNPKDERNDGAGRLEKLLGDTRSSCHVIGIRYGLQNQKDVSSKHLLLEMGETFIWILVENLGNDTYLMEKMQQTNQRFLNLMRAQDRKKNYV